MPQLIYIFAQRGDDDSNWVKIAFGLIVVAFWLISAFATWLNKKQEEERRRRLREQADRGSVPVGVPHQHSPVRRPSPMPAQTRRDQVIVGVPRPVPQRQPQPRPAQQRPMQQRPPQRASAKPPRPPAQRARVTAPPPMIEVATEATTLPVTATEISAAHPTGSAARPAANAASVARWLRPETLRQQFILTEILQPPVALRDPTD